MKKNGIKDAFKKIWTKPVKNGTFFSVINQPKTDNF